MEHIIFILCFSPLILNWANSTPLPSIITPSSRNFSYNSSHQLSNETIAELVQKQTDTIKKLVSSHQSGISVEYPIITKLPLESKPKPQSELDGLTMEELKKKCQFLAKLAAANYTKVDQPPPPTTTKKESPPPFRPNSGFYITTTKTTTTTPKPTTKPAQNVKYIKLEPVILQKTILNDGRTIYYWHKSLPSAVQLGPEATLSPTPAPTTTTTPSSGYNFRNFFPSFYSIGSAEPSSTTTTEKTTTPTTTTPSSTTTEEMLYQQQLRFVVPVPYSSGQEPADVRKPWDFDQFAYYPKPLQPDTINLQVPYIPTFHVIKALAVPNQPESLDNVNI